MDNHDFFKGSAKKWRKNKFCFFCGSKDNLQRAHLFPRKLTNEFVKTINAQMIYLPMCKECHQKYDWIVHKIIEPIIFDLKEKYSTELINYLFKSNGKILSLIDEIQEKLKTPLLSNHETRITNIEKKLYLESARIDLIETQLG